MTATPYLLQLADPDTAPARQSPDTYVVVAESSADALAFVQNYSSKKVWANVTPTTLTEAADMTGWRLRVAIFNTDGTTYFDQTVTNAGQVEGKTFATGTLTNDGTNVTDGDTVTINGKVYTLQTTLTNVDGHVHIGASNTATMTNLFNAINGSGGTPGTDYALATTPNADVTATNPTGTTVVLTAKVEGTAGNAVTTTEASSHLSFGAATLTGGTNSTNKMSSLAELMVAALTGTTHASFNDSTHTLTVSTIADDIGDHRLTVQVTPPTTDYVSPTGVATSAGESVPGFVSTITDGGIAGAALTVILAADTYGVPALIVQARVQE